MKRDEKINAVALHVPYGAWHLEQNQQSGLVVWKKTQDPLNALLVFGLWSKEGN